MASVIEVPKKKDPVVPEPFSRNPLQEYISFLQRIFQPSSSGKKDDRRSA